MRRGGVASDGLRRLSENSPMDPDAEATPAALERELLGGDRVYTRDQVAQRAGVSTEHARTLWRALGFADLNDDNVAFTDLVGFTSLTRQADETELAALVERFESLAADVVAAHGGRVVKTVGDEVMFTSDDAPAGAEIALVLSERAEASGVLPEMRV